MSKRSLPFSLLTLFTSPERAVSIQGDLTEEAQTRRRFWFWSQVLRTTGALCWKGFPRNPFMVAGLTVLGVAAWLLIGVVLVNRIDWAEAMLEARGISIAIRAAPVMLFGGFVAGILMVRIAPVRGIYACVSAVAAMIPFVTLVAIINARPPDSVADFVTQTLIGLTLGLLLLGGSLAMRRGPAKANRA